MERPTDGWILVETSRSIEWILTRELLTQPNSAVSGGFAIVQPGSQLSINAVEGFPLEEFSADVCPVFQSLFGS